MSPRGIWSPGNGPDGTRVFAHAFRFPIPAVVWRRCYVRQVRSIGLPGYRGAGLSNQRMALEIAVGIAHLTDRRLELFDLPLLENRGGPDVPLRITDVIDIPIP